MRIDNAMLLTEQRANEKRRTIYTVVLVIFLFLTFCGTHVVNSLVSYSNGYAGGMEAQKNLPRKTQSPVQPVDLFKDMPCAEVAACYSQRRMGRVKQKGMQG